MTVASAESRAGATRHDRRRARTRSRLVAAARQVIARKGFEATTIVDITEQADVGFGTFYNYFDSKEAILAAASGEVIEAHGAMLDRLTAAIDDPAEVVAVSVRHTLRLVERDPVLAGFSVRVGLYRAQMEAGLGPRLARDIRQGMKSGRFPPGNVRLLQHAIGGVLVAAMRAKLAGELTSEADDEVAACVLRLLSVPPAESRRIAARPLPRIDEPTVRRRGQPPLQTISAHA